MFSKHGFITVCLVFLTVLLITGCLPTSPAQEPPAPIPPTEVTVSAISVTPTTMTLALLAGGATETITATVSPSNATNKNVVWTSSNTAVATVAGGVVTPVTEGTTIITVTTVDGGLTAICEVTVVLSPVTVTGITLYPVTMTLIAGGATETITATVSPSNATNKNVVWTSSNTAVATVAGGVVTPVAVGDATITATSAGNTTKTAITAVTVAEAVAPPITEPVPLGTPLTKDGITVTIQTIEVISPPISDWCNYEVNIYFSIINNSERVLNGAGHLYYVLDEEIYEDEFNGIGYLHIGDAISWIYPGESRSVGYNMCFHSPVTIKQITWTGYFSDDPQEIELGSWEN